MNGIVGQKTGTWMGRMAFLPVFLFLSVLLSGCEAQDLTLPTRAEVEDAYLYPGGLEARMRGNVAEVTITQAARDLRRGGTLWAKVGPYVLLFSEETEGLFTGFPGLAGVRVITVSSDGNEVARALLARDSLNGITWRRALHIAGLARRDGTRRPSLLEELVEWGEDHTEYTYSPRYSRP
ncbi:MAG: hypothetical protein HKO65_01670 [Gemmatimonadetes bacterium]|nr:hypothetical protein [Gemmatimonadota bacterium]NNM03783.1 hypothetical protein [Gemmatimonadota bacterium]